MFKYQNNNRSSRANRSNNRYNHSNSFSIGFHPRRRICQGFFINPYLKIEGLVSTSQKITIYEGEHKKEFEAIIWNLRIKNIRPRLSRNVKTCIGNVYFDSIKKELPLNWKTSRERYWFPEFPLNDKELNQNEAFLANLGKYTTYTLYNHAGMKSIDIPVEESGELIF